MMSMEEEKTTENTTYHDNNIEIASKTLTSINLYTKIESYMYYNSYLRTWRDKHDVVRSMDFHGNQYTGGMNSDGSFMIYQPFK